MPDTTLLLPIALKSREARVETNAVGSAMMGPMYSLREIGARHGFRGFHLRLSTLQGYTSAAEMRAASGLEMTKRGTKHLTYTAVRC